MSTPDAAPDTGSGDSPLMIEDNSPVEPFLWRWMYETTPLPDEPARRAETLGETFLRVFGVELRLSSFDARYRQRQRNRVKRKNGRR